MWLSSVMCYALKIWKLVTSDFQYIISSVIYSAVFKATRMKWLFQTIEVAQTFTVGFWLAVAL